MATSKKKGGIKVVHKEQRESLPASIHYRVISQIPGQTATGQQLGRVIGYAENYADAENMATRHVKNVSKVRAQIDEFNDTENVWQELLTVEIRDNKIAFFNSDGSFSTEKK